ncbi:Uma2 family endonuclease [Baaleninema simplex]|uniref:Uma2 family endonuclease n=1 Tax=Baaleninema simplex TaxID=2862350 RepID=UPI000362E9A1|nr:Uma2 family endonuclease [Baaleninema simplex]
MLTVSACPIDLRKIELPAGRTLTLRDIDWPEFERISSAFGERSRSRLAYVNGRLELRMPSPEHEKVKRFIAIAVEIWLDALNLDWEPYGSTTFKREDIGAGIEPDDCFYVQNAARMTGLRRVDLQVDPPPDLAIEVDITSPTRLEAYAQLGVPELWRYRDGTVEIWQWCEGQYRQHTESSVLPEMPVLEGMALFLPRLASESMSGLKREFRDWVRDRLTSI